MIYLNKKGYSIIIAIFIIGFLFVLTSGILKLVLAELNDNKGRNNYLKAYYAAEGAGELAMLKLKENSYGYNEKLEIDGGNTLSTILKLDGNYIYGRDPLISFDIGSKTNDFSGTLNPLGYDVIPLFYIEKNMSGVVEDLKLSSSSLDIDQLSWNIISVKSGLTGTGIFDMNTNGLSKSLDSTNNFLVENKQIKDFLVENRNNLSYLVIFNSNNIKSIDYKLTSSNYFTKPRTEILVSSKMANYKQNFNIKYDNTEYLGILKYSIWSE